MVSHPVSLGGRGGEIIQASEWFPIFFLLWPFWLLTELHAPFPVWVVSHVRVAFPFFSGPHFLLLLAQWLLVVVVVGSRILFADATWQGSPVGETDEAAAALAGMLFPSQSSSPHTLSPPALPLSSYFHLLLGVVGPYSMAPFMSYTGVLSARPNASLVVLLRRY